MSGALMMMLNVGGIKAVMVGGSNDISGTGPSQHTFTLSQFLTVTGGTPTAYEWYVNGVATSSAQNYGLTVATNSSDTVYVVVTIGGANYTSNTVIFETSNTA